MPESDAVVYIVQFNYFIKGAAKDFFTFIEKLQK